MPPAITLILGGVLILASIILAVWGVIRELARTKPKPGAAIRSVLAIVAGLAIFAVGSALLILSVE